MALRTESSPVSYITRIGTSGNVNYNGAYTLMVAIRLPDLASVVGSNIYPLMVVDESTGERDALYVEPSDDRLKLWINDGSTDDVSDVIDFDEDTIYWAVLRRNSGTSIDCFLFPAGIGSAPTPDGNSTLNVGTSRPASGYQVYAGIRQSDIDCLRGWNVALTNAEIFAEISSRTAVKASPVFDISVCTEADTSDTAGSNDFQVDGDPGFNVTTIADLIAGAAPPKEVKLVLQYRRKGTTQWLDVLPLSQAQP